MPRPTTKETVMRTLALFTFAALAFSLLVGGIELWWTRQARRDKEQSAIVLHPFTTKRVRKVRSPLSTRAEYYVSLFFGFLLAAYVGTVLVRMVYNLVVARIF
jgi:hypothetical protein